MTAPYVRPMLRDTYESEGPASAAFPGGYKVRHNSDSRILIPRKPTIDYTQQGPQVSNKRSKVSRACDECRRRKTRCDIDLQPEGCSSCRRAKVDCTFERTQLKRGPSKRPRSLSTNATTMHLSVVPPSLASLRSPDLKADSPLYHHAQGHPQEKLPGIGALLAWSGQGPNQAQNSGLSSSVPTNSGPPPSPGTTTQTQFGSAPAAGTLPILVEVACAQPSMQGMTPFPIMSMHPPASPQSPSRFGSFQATPQIANLHLGSGAGSGGGPEVNYLSAQYMLPNQHQPNQHQPNQAGPQSPNQHQTPPIQHQTPPNQTVPNQTVPNQHQTPPHQPPQPQPHQSLSLNPHDAQVLTEYYTWWHPIFPVLPNTTDELVEILSDPDSRGLINAMTGAVTTLPVPIHQDKQSRYMHLIELVFLYLRSLEYAWLGAAAANVISMLSTDPSPRTTGLFAVVAALDRLHSLTHNTTPLVGHRDGLAHLNSPPGSENLVKVLRALELVPGTTPSSNRDTRGWLSPPPEHTQDATEAALHWLTRLKDSRAKTELRHLLPSVERTPLASFVRVATMN